MTKHLKRLAALLAIIFILSATCVMNISAAVSYEGTGKQADPYLVKTVEQLKGMIDNPTAFYKLANTIDLKGEKNFAPIGNLANKFKGTFTCDTKSDGTPKYIIKNFTQTVSPKGATLKEKYSGYKKDGKSGWECGLFGAAEGATFTNIVVLNANIKSTVEGSYQMNGDFSTNPGMDEQAAGILCSLAKNCNFTGCGVSGKVTSASNHVGGLVGHGENTNLTQCYSYATVKSTGKWGSGGLAGSGTGKITECFYEGTFTGGETHAGALLGSYRDDRNVQISDCYAAGTVTTKSSGCFLGTKNHEDGFSKENIEVTKNSFTMAKLKGNSAIASQKVPAAKAVKCFLLKGKGVLEKYFYPVSKAELAKEFKSLAAWEIKGGLPVLKNVHPVKDASKYKVEKATASGGAAGSTTGDNTAGTQSNVATPDAQGNTATDGNNAATEGTTGTVAGGNATYEIKTQFDYSLMGLSKAELIVVLIIAVLILLVLAGGIIAVVMMLKLTKAANNAIFDDFDADDVVANDIE